MAGLREIQSRIKSIQDTRKITNAMYMISSTKMKKAKQALEATEPYFYTLQSTIARILRHLPEMEHMYFEKPEVKRTRIGLLVITGDKGLAGAYNHNILNLAQKFLDNTENHVKLFIVGELGRQYPDIFPLRKTSAIRFKVQTLTGPDGSVRRSWNSTRTES